VNIASPARTKGGFVIDAPPQASLSIANSTERFPVHRVYCVGRNYAAHAVEMGHDPDKEPPFFFQKNPDNPLKSGGDDIKVEDALDCVYGYGVSLDMTRRDLQGEMKKLGRPWEIGKAFEMSAPSGPIIPVSTCGHIESGDIWLKVNDEVRQSGDVNQMIWKTGEMISILSTLFTLRPGDIIQTGTPSGVGPVQRGDRMHGHVAGVGDLKVTVT